ncbi:MAG TPA: hypothetical protein GX015_02845 [Corynebacterium sp.]|uniref:hypothetical protein n=1 Tax=Corynebacterium sp. TaxID=1720 RepID=UPI00180D8D48|nr:hypothetical protein [Corynebacterium sp.]HHT31473.1 hypothetical protein [Corynebacterium sp.]
MPRSSRGSVVGVELEPVGFEVLVRVEEDLDEVVELLVLVDDEVEVELLVLVEVSVALLSDVAGAEGAAVGISGSSFPVARYRPRATATTNTNAAATTPMAMARVFVVAVPRLPGELMGSL